jgi:hypothetical protein
MTRWSKVTPTPHSPPAVRACGSSWLITGRVASLTFSSSPSAQAKAAVVASMTTTSACGSAFWARSVPSIWALVTEPKY